MKTTVIQLENYDEVVSIKDKMSWRSPERIILVWPKRGRILDSELDLALLQRAAASFGSKITLVTHHPLIKEWAEGLSVSVFASVAAAENWDWKMPVEKTKGKKAPQGLTMILEKKAGVSKTKSRPASRSQKAAAIGASLSALIALFVVIIPSAQITYYPVTTQKEITINIKASEVFSGASPSGGIPASVAFIEVSGELSRPSSGNTTIPTKKASGNMTFTNLTSSPVTIPAGTLLQTETEAGILFQTLDKKMISSGIGETIEVSVEALTPGSEGNITAGEIIIIVGDLGEMLSVSNPSAFSGGESIDTPSPNDNDYAVLESQLLADLSTQGSLDLRASLDQGTVMIEESLELDNILLEEKLNPVGEPSDEAVLRLSVRFSALTYQKSDLETIATLVLNSYPLEGYQPLNGTITLQQSDEYQLDQLNQATWTMKASQVLTPDWDTETTAQKISGLTVKAAKVYLASLFDQSEPARIELITGWWPWMPMLPTQIHFVNGVAP